MLKKIVALSLICAPLLGNASEITEPQVGRFQMVAGSKHPQHTELYVLDTATGHVWKSSFSKWDATATWVPLITEAQSVSESSFDLSSSEL